MPLFVGGERVGDLFYDGRRIEYAYLGSTLVYQPMVGFVDEFNRSSIGPNWSSEDFTGYTVENGSMCSDDAAAWVSWDREYTSDDARVTVTIGSGEFLGAYIAFGVRLWRDAEETPAYLVAANDSDGESFCAIYSPVRGSSVGTSGLRPLVEGDEISLEVSGGDIRVLLNGIEVVGMSGEGYVPTDRYASIMLGGCITRFEVSEPGEVTRPRREVRHFTTSGSFTTDLPAWTRHVRALAWGGGGGGHGGDGAIVRNGRGGSAGTATVLNLDGHAIPLTNFPVTVGAGGAGGSKEKSGSSGGATSPGGVASVPGGAGGSTYSSSSGGNAGDLTLRDGTVIAGGSGGSTNNDGSAPGGGGGGGAGGLFGSARSGGRGGDGRVTLDIVDQAWIDAYGTGE